MGQIDGTRTAGAVLGGSLFPLPGDNLMHLAVSAVTVDGERLEGVGVIPNIEVPLDLPYCNDQDPQVARAIEVLVKQVRAQQLPRRKISAFSKMYRRQGRARVPPSRGSPGDSPYPGNRSI